MTKAIFAGKNIKEFALNNSFAVLAFINTNFAPFAENFFLRNRPRNRSDND